MLTKKWDMIAEVVEIGARGRSYTIRSETGRLYRRNRRYLKRYNPPREETADESGSTDEEQENINPAGPRRSNRRPQKTKKYQG